MPENETDDKYVRWPPSKDSPSLLEGCMPIECTVTASPTIETGKKISVSNGVLLTFLKFSLWEPPLSSLESDVFLNKFQSGFLQSSLCLQPHIPAWYRYVDDILCIWDGPTTELGSFL